jgi:hypothetical protein
MKNRIITAIKGIFTHTPNTCTSARFVAGAGNRARLSASQAYLRALRQAELQSWEQSGGDVLASNSRSL